MIISHLPQEPVSLGDLKSVNRRHVLMCFRGGQSATVQDVCQQTGISRPTVIKCIHFFLDRGMLVSLGKGTSTKSGGKPPETYALTEEKCFLCLTLWPGSMRMHVYTVGQTLLAQKVMDKPLPHRCETASQELLEATVAFLQAASIAPECICAVSHSTSGIVDHETNTLLFSSQSPEWGTQLHPLEPFMDVFPQALFFMDNAGKFTARPFLLQPGLAKQRVLVLFTTWGIAGCLMERGHILNGPNALIGEIGHMLVAPNDPELCGCGSRGCFERQVSPERLKKTVLDMAPMYPSSPLVQKAQSGAITIADLFETSENGDALARRIAIDWGSLFANFLRNLSLTFDPDQVVLQGDFAYADEAFRDSLMASLQTFRYYARKPPFQVHFDQRSLEDMDTLGAYLALDHLYFDRDDCYADGD